MSIVSLISELEAQLTHTAALVAPSTVSVGRDPPRRRCRRRTRQGPHQRPQPA
ncbi:MAG: hypothetical protein V9G12_04660 [Microthrixaceae bacterium]